MMYQVIKFLVAPFVRFFWLGTLDGYDNIPKRGSFILASNHKSYLDFILIFCFFPRKVSFLTAEVFFKSWFWKPIMLMTNQIRVDRDSADKSKTFIEVDNLFKNNGVLGVFPEGTRSRDGKMHRGYTGVIKFARKYNVPILPIGIKGTFDALSPQMKIPKIKKCDIKIGALHNVVSEFDEIELKILMEKIAFLSGEDYDE